MAPKMDISASDAAFYELRRRILAGRYQPGAFLSNQGLAADLSLSRTPVRDALRRLETEGLVVIAPRSGATVRKFQPEEITDLCILRAVIEAGIVEVSAQRRLPEDLAQARACHEKMREIYRRIGTRAPSETEAVQLGDLDYQFHASIVQGARSRLMAEEFARLQIWLTLHGNFLRIPAGHRSSPKKILSEHKAIIEAVAQRDSKKARRLMEEHLLHLVDGSIAHRGNPAPFGHG
jgi:DNA-binding GntR family transcriptional regulator